MSYGVEVVAKLLSLSVGRVRSYARDGLIPSARGKRGEYRFSFRDLVIARIARDLVAHRVPKRKILRSIAALQETLPEGRSLTELQIGAEAGNVVVEDEDVRWNPATKQLHFHLSDFAREVAPLARKQVKEARRRGLSADDSYELGCDLEELSPVEAGEAYRRALALDPRHAGAHVNLGRLLHEQGEFEAAERHYRLALPDPTAAFDLGVVLEDGGRAGDALEAYEIAIAEDPNHADAHYNAAGICERLGRQSAALRYLNRYRRLTR